MTYVVKGRANVLKLREQKGVVCVLATANKATTRLVYSAGVQVPGVAQCFVITHVLQPYLYVLLFTQIGWVLPFPRSALLTIHSFSL